MIYWRIQMNQPNGRDDIKINSLDLLNEEHPVIGTGEWNDIQCKYFKGEHENGIKIDDIILVHEGNKPIALCKVLSESYTNEELKIKYSHDNYRDVKVLGIYEGNEKFPAAQGTIERLINETKSRKFISSFYESIIKNKKMEDTTKVLLHKKQIILQGPPGTGKTRLAKQIAEELCGDNAITVNDLKSVLNVNDSIPKSSGTDPYYKILAIDESGVSMQSEKSNSYKATLKKIFKKYNQLCRGEEPTNKNGNEPYEFAVAKYLFEKLGVKSPIGDYKIVQFHPSYTYEDFVRGISVENNEDGKILYKTKNRVLGEFAKKSQENYNLSKDKTQSSNIESWIEEKLTIFKEDIIAKLPEEETRLSDSITIFDYTETAFKYGKDWQGNGYLKFSEFRALIKAVINDEIELSKINLDKEKFRHAHYRYTYYGALLKLFFETYQYQETTETVEEKNYVLIIDEINRANLSSVLGELIYALEYRGESVESMYDIKGDREITLPPNLYIIGTMNTADRSVGQIDYAIRRRFAFVDVLPEVLSESDLNSDKKEDDPILKFNEVIFLKVQELFLNNGENSKYLSEEFNAKDVQLGHSYFIYEESKFNLKLEYEILPILREYVADGILKASALDFIKELEK